MNTLQAIKDRKSVRTYLEKPVEPDKIRTVAEAGNMAAKAGKLYFTVVSNKAVLDKWGKTGRAVMQNSGNTFLMKASSDPSYSPLYHAPVAVIISAETTADEHTQSMNSENAACAAQNMLLAATELGLGSCYIVSAALALNVPEIRQSVKLSGKLQPVCIVVFGYTEDTVPHKDYPKQPENITYIL